MEKKRNLKKKMKKFNFESKKCRNMKILKNRNNDQIQNFTKNRNLKKLIKSKFDTKKV